MARPSQPDVPDRAPLFIDADRIGSVDGQALALLCAQHPINDRKEVAASDVSQAGLRRHGDVTAVLAGLGHTLHQASLCPGPTGEILTVWSANDQPIGRVDRAYARALGLATRSVHLVLSTDNGLWIQKRSITKTSDPGLWDTTVGGTCCDGESLQETLERELWEEAGLRVTDIQHLTPMGSVTVQGPCTVQGFAGYQVERIECLLGYLGPTSTPTNQDGEVECFDHVSLGEARSLIMNGKFTQSARLVLARCLDPQRLGLDRIAGVF